MDTTDWNKKFSGDAIFRENKQQLLSGFSDDSIPSENHLSNGEKRVLNSSSHESSTDNRLSSGLHGSSKRTRNQNQNTNQTCLVDGCESDLSNCKDYHRRHRVCDFHSKTPTVLIKGEEKRFCQQCSRFHSLSEFDEVKRSCRKRLDGHNRRRRKPQPESLFMTSRDFLSNCKGPIVLQFSNPEIHVTNMNRRSMWPNFGRSEEKEKSKGGAMFESNSCDECLNSGGLGPFCGSISDSICVGNEQEQSGSSFKTLPTDIEMSSSSPVDSGCALYLLSSHSAQSAVPNSSGLSFLAHHSHSNNVVPIQTQRSDSDSDLHFSTLTHLSASSFGMRDYKTVSKTSFHGDLMLQMDQESHNNNALFQTQLPHKFPISWE